jgi:hypothetical protein
MTEPGYVGLAAALDAAIRDVRERYSLSTREWWILLPARLFPQVARMKREYVRDIVEVGLHGYGGLVGFELADDRATVHL